MRRGHVFAAENQHTGAGARLAFPSCSADIGTGGWRWTSHSPPASGPEGSSPNELRFGSLVSLPLFRHAGRARHGKALPKHLEGGRRTGQHSTMSDAETRENAPSPGFDLGAEPGAVPA